MTPTHPGDREATTALQLEIMRLNGAWQEPARELSWAEYMAAGLCKAGFSLTPSITSDDERRAVGLAETTVAVVTNRAEFSAPTRYWVNRAKRHAHAVLSLHAELERVRK